MFLFGRKQKPNDVNKIYPDESNLEIDSFQPNNHFKDLILFPYFNNSVRNICVLDDEKRIVTGDDDGNVFVWDAEFGTKKAELKLHQGAITNIIKYSNVFCSITQKQINLICVSGTDKQLSVWNIDNYKLICSDKFGLNLSKIFLNCNNNTLNQNCFIVAGLDLKLYDTSLNEIDEYSRKTKDNSIKFMILIKNDKLVLATNSDIEVYGLINSNIHSSESDDMNAYENYNSNNENNDIKDFRIKELKKYINVHKDSILCLDNLSDKMFASGSSDGTLILWQSENLTRCIELKPFDELNQNEALKRLNLTSVNCFKCLYDRYFVICSGFNICIYDVQNNEFICKIHNAHHSSKISDLILLNSEMVATSAEDGSIRVWKFIESFNNTKKQNQKLEIKLVLIGECLGHSASILSLNTITRNEIISSGYDNMVIIWRNSSIVDYNRNLNINKILSNVNL